MVDFFIIIMREELIKKASEKLSQLDNESLQKFINFPIKAITDWEMLNTLYNDYNVNSINDIRKLLNKN